MRTVRVFVQVCGQGGFQAVEIGAFTAVLGETGLRKSEGLRLTWDAIDVKRRKVTVKDSKSGKPRYIPLSGYALSWLDRLIRVIDNPYVFICVETLQPWKDPRGPFKTGCHRAKLGWVRGFHQLRYVLSQIMFLVSTSGFLFSSLVFSED